MKITVNGEQPFQVGAPNFAISPSSSGYTLNFSADGLNFTPWDESTAANTTQVVVDAALGMYFILDGNTDDNIVITY